MTTATMSYGVRARERMPFAWDYITLGLVACLLLIGLIMVTSASMSIAARDLGNPFYFLERQFIFGLVGLMFAWVLTRVPAELWDKYSLALLCLGLALLLLVLIPGIGAMVNGARRWLFGLQPSEFAKIAFILLLANLLSGPANAVAPRRVAAKSLSALPSMSRSIVVRS